MRRPLREPRRPNLATIVGSGLAVAAAGSLLAFSSLAEQAGLQGLATGGLQPAVPGRGSATRTITVPAPAAPPAEPASSDGALRDLVAEVVSSAPARTPPATTPVKRPTPPPAPRERRPERPERRSDPALAARRVATAAPASWETGGPPYGKAKGHYKHGDESTKAKKPKTPRKGGNATRSHGAPDAPVYAKTKASGGKKWKAPKMKKVTKKPASSHGKAKGHDKHAHNRGKGKGHSKHGH